MSDSSFSSLSCCSFFLPSGNLIWLTPPWHPRGGVFFPDIPALRGRRRAFQLMDNKRGDPRQRVLKSGKIVFAGGSFSVDCTIRNLSTTGARLQVPTTVAIPDRFVLVDAHAGTRREATVVWRKADQLGVRFEPPKT